MQAKHTGAPDDLTTARFSFNASGVARVRSGKIRPHVGLDIYREGQIGAGVGDGRRLRDEFFEPHVR